MSTFTKVERLVTHGLVLAEIFGGMYLFLPSRPKRYRNNPHNLCCYWIDLNQTCTNVAKICDLTPVNRNCDIRIRFRTPACWMKVVLPILRKIGCHGDVPWGIGKQRPNRYNARKYLSFGEKIAKIGPVDPEIIWLKLKKKLRKVKNTARGRQVCRVG